MKVVVALGGNALQTKGSDPSAEEQLKVIKKTCGYIAELSVKHYELAIVHGNGPQIGRILLASEYAQNIVPVMPFDVCGAMSQGYIGYQLQQALKQALKQCNMNIPVVSLVTQIVVDDADPAFLNPTKPIGGFYEEKEAKKLEAEKGYIMREDAKRGWRRVVASPKPKRIVEIHEIKKLWNDTIVIACGGGGVPVIEKPDGGLKGAEAVIDKDFAAELLAEQVNADVLLILTGVEKVCLNYNEENQKELSHLNLKEAARYIKEQQFYVGSMLPKVQAAMQFVRLYPDKKAIITSLDKAAEALEGKTGTVVTYA
ncbi:MAG: carbamate kinase [Muricomes sp.]|uniref:carbamate kinase n=1 Tax=Faecalicatena contorta TaxID=39482 RepID=UPI002ECB5F7E|nr:carbamate kinase [Muricomes sp.]